MHPILLLFAHPRFEKSRINKALLSSLRDQEHITVHDLYEHYPDFNIDAAHEKQLLLSHHIVIWQSPFYMYGAPAIIKQWIDMVLDHGWAHGSGGRNVENKILFNTITTGGTRQGYARGGFNRFTIRELLTPFEQTAHLCNMIYLPPFTVQGTHLLTDSELAHVAGLYQQALHHLAHGTFDVEEVRRHEFLNDWIEAVNAQDKP